MTQEAEPPTPDLRSILRGLVVILASIAFLSIIPIWPLLGMGTETLYHGGLFDRMAFYVLVLSPILLLAAIGSSLLSKRHFPIPLLVGAWAMFLVVALCWMVTFKAG